MAQNQSLIHFSIRTECRIWVNIDLEGLRHLRLKVVRQHLFVVRLPDGVSDAVGLQCMKSLEIQEYIWQTGAGRITIAYGLQGKA